MEIRLSDGWGVEGVVMLVGLVHVAAAPRAWEAR
jgi:hypothetical protein